MTGANRNGVSMTVEIGNGVTVFGNYNTIEWGDGPYFIKSETDLNGGATYTISGTSQLLSVPFALHAQTAESITGTINEQDPKIGQHQPGKLSMWNGSQLVSSGITDVGAVGIGVDQPDEKLEVDGNVKALGFIGDGSGLTNIPQSSSLGSWQTRNKDQVYRAEADGFVVVSLQMPSGSVRYCVAKGFTDSSASPTTLRIASSVVDNEGTSYYWPQYGGFTMPVKKNDYWKVEIISNVTVNPTIYWLPMGQ